MGVGTNRERRRRSRPRIEALEGRAIPTTFHVSNVAQLQADLAAVNNTATPNTIVLAPGEYDLTGQIQIQNAGNLKIEAVKSNAGTANLVAAFGNRVFEIDGGDVTLSGLTVSGGGGGAVTQGGGIDAQNAVLTVENCTIIGNSASQEGGGIDAQGGTLTVKNSTVNDNAATGGAHAFGGGIAASNAAVTVWDSTINNDAAIGLDLDPRGAANAGGGGIFAQGGTLTVSGSTISNNTAAATTTGTSAAGSGGGVATSNAIVSVTRTAVTGNTVTALGGTQGNTTRGGAFTTVGGSLTVTNSQFSGNAPAGSNEFDHPAATVVLHHSTVGGKKFPGSYTLGDKGFAANR